MADKLKHSKVCYSFDGEEFKSDLSFVINEAAAQLPDNETYFEIFQGDVVIDVAEDFFCVTNIKIVGIEKMENNQYAVVSRKEIGSSHASN